jgi:hypothetical protein
VFYSLNPKCPLRLRFQLKAWLLADEALGNRLDSEGSNLINGLILSLTESQYFGIIGR